jgi:hypothetical protein
MRRALLFSLIVCVVVVPAMAMAQTRPSPPAKQPARRPPAKKNPIGFRAYVGWDFEALTASKSFDAVTGSSSFNGPAGGFEVLNLWHKVFVRVTFAHMSQDGQRVFVNNGQVFPLNIPLTVGMTPIELGAGFRHVTDKKGRYTVYAGVSALFLKYSETMTGGTSDDNTNKTFTGVTLFGGLERRFKKYVVAGVEAQYRGVPNAIGTAGVSQAFNETNLGGFAVRVLFGVKR